MKEENGSVVVDDVGAPNQKDNSKDYKLLHRILNTLMVAIVILIVAVLIPKNLTDTIDDTPLQENPSEQGEGSTGGTGELADVQDEINEIEEKIDALITPDTEQVISVYQEHIDNAADSNRKADLLYARIFAIQDRDLDNQYGAQVIDDAIQADEILKSVNSAGQVVNEAYTYGFDSVADEYTAILEQREKEMGIDSSVETVG